MEREYFTKQEALEKVGKIIEALADFSGVAKGSSGTVIKTDRAGKDQWSLAIQWRLPTKKPSIIHGRVGDEPSTYIETSKPLVDWFSKYEYENFLEELSE